VVGVDLGGSNLRGVIADKSGEPLLELAEDAAGGDADAVIGQLVSLCRRLAVAASATWSSVASVCVGVPGVVDRGQLELAPNLPPFGDVDLEAVLADELGVPVVVENDVNLATKGEHRHGHGMGIDDFVFVAVGTGVGMGIVAGGKLLRGAQGAAGEVGLLPVDGSTLEEVAGGVGLVRRFAARSGRNAATAQEVFAAAAEGDTHAVGVLDEQAGALAHLLVRVQAILDPALAVLGGGMGSRPDVVNRVRRALAPLGPKPGVLRVSALGERAGVVGALESARERVPRPAEEGVSA
jgi:glucokinase